MVFMFVHTLLMNSWIQRNIIFPKINQQYRRSSNKKNNDSILPSSIRLSNKKSLNIPTNQLTGQERRNHSLHIRNMDPEIIKSTQKGRLDMSTIQTQQQERGFSVRKRLALLKLFPHQKNMLQAGSPRSIPEKKKLSKELSYNAQKIMMEADDNFQAQLNHKKTSILKLKTQQIKINIFSQRQYPSQQLCNESLTIQKSLTFDYNELPKGESMDKAIGRRRYTKVKPEQKFKETSRKITSIRGWNHMEQTLMIPQYSDSW